MGTTDQNADGTDATGSDDAGTQNLNPRDTDHPTGAQQAAENAENEPPS